MITADTLRTLTTLGTYSLGQLLHSSGYSGASFKSSEFSGINSDGDFVYTVTYWDDAGTGEETGRVFIHYDAASHKISADY